MILLSGCDYINIMIKHIDKPWGREELLATNPKYTVKRLFMKKGHQCSYQYHRQKMETILVLQGELMIIMENETKKLQTGEVITIKPLEKHRMRAENQDCLYLECSTSELDDVVRIEDDYNRT